jgi:Putative metal-binding motif
VPTVEDCDNADNDCDTKIDEGVQNACGTCATLEHSVGEACSNGGQGACAKPGKYSCFNGTTVCDAPPATPTAEVCDGIDNDCSGGVDNGLLNACGGSTCGADLSNKGKSCTAGTGDCQGTGTWECDGPAANTLKCTAVEKPKNACGTSCGPVPAEDCATPGDDNCNGQSNEGCCTPVTWYRDCDADGFAAASAPSQSSCTAPPPPAGCAAWTKTVPGTGSTDCNDGNAAYKPGGEAAYLTAGTGDFNCDGQIEKAVVVLATTAGTPAPASAQVCSETVRCPCLQINRSALDFDHLDGATPVDAAGQPLTVTDDIPTYGADCAIAKRYVVSGPYAIPISGDPTRCTTAITEASHSIDIYYFQVLCR